MRKYFSWCDDDTDSHQDIFGKSCKSWHRKLFGETHSPFLVLKQPTFVFVIVLGKHTVPFSYFNQPPLSVSRTVQRLQRLKCYSFWNGRLEKQLVCINFVKTANKAFLYIMQPSMYWSNSIQATSIENYHFAECVLSRIVFRLADTRCFFMWRFKPAAFVVL